MSKESDIIERELAELEQLEMQVIASLQSFTDQFYAQLNGIAGARQKLMSVLGEINMPEETKTK